MAGCPSLRFQGTLRRQVASWKANLEAALVPRGFPRSCGGPESSIVQDTTPYRSVAPPAPNQDALVRMRHVTAAPTIYRKLLQYYMLVYYYTKYVCTSPDYSQK